MIYTENEDLAEGVRLTSSSHPTAARGGLFATTIRKVTLLVVVVLLGVVIVPVVISVVAPDYRYTTQGEDIASGTLVVDGVGVVSFMLLDWTKRFDWKTMSDVFDEGAPRVLIVDDLQDGGGHHTEGHSSTEYPWAVGFGYATSSDGTIVYEYATNTTQDQIVSFSIDGTPYDLSMGGLFLIRTADGLTVQQVDVDMPVFSKSDYVVDAVQSFAESNEAILAFLNGTRNSYR